MLAIVFALASSLAWGLSDFLGGLTTRRQPLLTVLVFSQGVALLVLLAVIAAGAPVEHDRAATLWAAGSGVIGLIGLAAFYHALSIGTMSIVAPVTATGTWSRCRRHAVRRAAGSAAAGGHRPRGVRGRARLARSAARGRRRAPRRATAIVLALVAAVGFGSFLAGIDRPSRAATPPGCCSATRIGTGWCWCRWRCSAGRRSRARAEGLLAILAIGVFDMLANCSSCSPRPRATQRGRRARLAVPGGDRPASPPRSSRAAEPHPGRRGLGHADGGDRAGGGMTPRARPRTAQVGRHGGSVSARRPAGGMLSPPSCVLASLSDAEAQLAPNATGPRPAKASVPGHSTVDHPYAG